MAAVELRITAAVEQARANLLAIRDELKRVATSFTAAAGSAERVSAAISGTTAATGKAAEGLQRLQGASKATTETVVRDAEAQRAQLLVTAEEYDRVAAAAEKGSAEQKAAQAASADLTGRAARLTQEAATATEEGLASITAASAKTGEAVELSAERAAAAYTRLAAEFSRTAEAAEKGGAVQVQATHAAADAQERAVAAAAKVVDATVKDRESLERLASSYKEVAAAAVKGSQAQVEAARLAEDADAKLRAGAGETAATTVRKAAEQRQALLKLVEEYKLVGAAAEKGSEEQRAAARLAADAQERAAALITTSAEKTAAAQKRAGEAAATSAEASKGGGLLAGASGKALGIVFGGVVATKGIEDLIDVAKEAQASQEQLANTMKDAGQNYSQYRDRIEEAVSSESKLAGVQKTDLRESFERLDRLLTTTIGSTQAVGRATSDMQLATDIAARTHSSLARATQIVSQVELGRVSLLRRIGIQLPQIKTAENELADSHAHVTAEVRAQAKAYDQQQTALAGVAALHKAYAGAAETYGQTASGSIARLHVAWRDFGIELGTKLLPLVADAAKFLADTLDSLGKNTAVQAVFEGIGTAVKDAMIPIRALWDVVRSFVRGFVEAFAGSGGANEQAHRFSDAMDNLRPVMERVAHAISGLSDQAGKLGGELGGVLVAALRGTVEAVKDVVGWFERHETVAKVLLGTVVGVVAAMKVYETTVRVVTAVTKAWAAAQALLDGAMEANPIGLIVTGIAALAAGLYLAYTRSATFRRVVNDLWAGLKEFGAGIARVVVPTLKTLMDVAGQVFGFMVRHWQLVLDAFGPLGFVAAQVIIHFRAILSTVRTVFGTAYTVISTFTGDLVGLFTKPIATVNAMWNQMETVVKTVFGSIVKIISGIVDQIPNKILGISTGAGSIKSALHSWVDEFDTAGQTSGDKFVGAVNAKLAAAVPGMISGPLGRALDGLFAGMPGFPGGTGAGGAAGARGATTARAQAGGTEFALATRARAYGVGSGAIYGETDLGSVGSTGTGGHRVIDCSGYAFKVYSDAGFKGFPGTSETQWAQKDGPNWTSKVINPALAGPGDLAFTTGSGYAPPGHVGIVVSGSGLSATVMQYYSHGEPADTIKLSDFLDGAFGVKRYYLVVGGQISAGPTQTAGGTAAAPATTTKGTRQAGSTTTAAYKADAAAAAEQFGVPVNQFIAQIQQESGFNPKVVSKAGAVGIAQFEPGTAKALGIDPRNPQQALTGAAKLMARLYQKYGDWGLALAAYNAGEGTVDKYLAGKGTLKPETTAYVAKITGDASALEGHYGSGAPTTAAPFKIPAGATGAQPLTGTQATSLRAQVEKLNDSAKGIADEATRKQIEAQIAALVATIHTGLGAKQAAAAKEDANKIHAAISGALSLDRTHASVKTGIETIQAELGKISNPRLKAEIQAQTDALMKAIPGANKQQVDGIRLDLIHVRSEISDALRFDSAIGRVRDGAQKIQDEIAKITNPRLRGQIKAEAKQLLDSLPGANPEDLATVQKHLKQLQDAYSSDLSLDRTIHTLGTQVGTIQQRLEQIVNPQLRAKVRMEAQGVLHELPGANPQDVDRVRAQVRRLNTAVSNEVTLDRGVQNARKGLSQLTAEFRTWPDTVKGPLAEQAAAISREFRNVLTAGDLNHVKTQMAALKAAIQAQMDAAKKAVEDARTAFETAWQRFVQAADSAFDKVTQDTIRTHRITVQLASGVSFDYGQGDLTPAQQELAQLQDQIDQQNRQQQMQDAQAALSDAQTKYQQILATGVGGVTPDGSTVSQSDINQAKKDVEDAQRQLDQTVLDQRVADLQKQADAEQKAADDQFQTWSDAYQAQRDVARTALDDQLEDLKVALENQQITWQGAMDAISGILGTGGQASSDAFWKAFNDANAAAVAAGGLNVLTGAQTAAGNLQGAQTSEQQLAPGAGAPDATAPGTAPGDYQQYGDYTPSTPSYGQYTTGGGSGVYQSGKGQYGHKPVPLADGGLVTRPTFALVGEAPGAQEAVMDLTAPRTIQVLAQAIRQAAAVAGRAQDARPRLPAIGAAFTPQALGRAVRDAARQAETQHRVVEHVTSVQEATRAATTATAAGTPTDLVHALRTALSGFHGGGETRVVQAVFPNAIIPGTDRRAARSLGRSVGPEIARQIGYTARIL